MKTIQPMSKVLMCAVVAVWACQTFAAVTTKTITYTDGDVTLKGHLAFDDALGDKRPGVLVVHEWWGLNDYAKKRAQQLASMGYVAFALDMYGEGKVAKHPQDARAFVGQVQSSIKAWQKRALAGLEVLRGHERVDTTRIAAIGYCFGGATVLQLAYAGADLRGVVSFHGSLPVPEGDQAKRIKAKVLICHGAADRFIPDERIKALRVAFDDGDVDWQMLSYGGAAHSFTNPGADAHGISGVSYDAKADRRSWGHMKMFFKEIFGN